MTNPVTIFETHPTFSSSKVYCRSGKKGFNMIIKSISKESMSKRRGELEYLLTQLLN